MKNLLYFTALLGVLSASDSMAMNDFSRSEKSAKLFCKFHPSQILTREDANALPNEPMIHISSNAIAVDDSAFRDNQKISHITLNYDMKYIGEFSFANSSVEYIEFGKSLSRIRRYAFAGCQDLKAVILPDNLKIIELNAFAGSGVNCLSVPGKFMVYSEKDNNGNAGIYIMPVNPSDGNWRTKIMTLAPDQELTVVTRKGGLNQEVVTTLGAGSSSDSED